MCPLFSREKIQKSSFLWITTPIICKPTATQRWRGSRRGRRNGHGEGITVASVRFERQLDNRRAIEQRSYASNRVGRYDPASPDRRAYGRAGVLERRRPQVGRRAAQITLPRRLRGLRRRARPSSASPSSPPQSACVLHHARADAWCVRYDPAIFDHRPCPTHS